MEEEKAGWKDVTLEIVEQAHQVAGMLRKRVEPNDGEASSDERLVKRLRKSAAKMPSLTWNTFRVFEVGVQSWGIWKNSWLDSILYKVDSWIMLSQVFWQKCVYDTQEVYIMTLKTHAGYTFSLNCYTIESKHIKLGMPTKPAI